MARSLAVCVVFFFAAFTVLGARVDDDVTDTHADADVDERAHHEDVIVDDNDDNDGDDAADDDENADEDGDAQDPQGDDCSQYDLEEDISPDPTTDPLAMGDAEVVQQHVKKTAKQMVPQDKTTLAEARDLEAAAHAMLLVKKKTAEETARRQRYAGITHRSTKQAKARAKHVAEKSVKAEAAFAKFAKDDAAAAEKTYAEKDSVDAQARDATVAQQIAESDSKSATYRAKHYEKGLKNAQAKAEQAEKDAEEKKQALADSEANVNATTEELQESAEAAHEALKEEHRAKRKLLRSKKVATKAKMARKMAEAQLEKSRSALDRANELEEHVTQKANEAEWATHGSSDALASQTAKTFTAFVKKSDSLKAAQHAVKKHQDASVKLQAAKAATALTKKNAIEAKAAADAEAKEAAGVL